MKYRKINTLLLGLVFSPFGLFAQPGDEIPTATVTDELCVSIDDTGSPISETYEIDISHLHLHSEKEANDKFGYISNNLLTYTVDFSAEKAYLNVHLDRTSEPKDVVWWNDYIISLCGL
ncbi:hypothetical protein [Crocinitomix algicola]|uniref:hypothetical protein n=1 Tax=Crocinitomix algicola TaxID=1740263 RepID=UPI00082EB6C5|nr:hypothetical protein [Crocinitomix algicola]